MEYSDRHRTLLQAVMGRGTVELEEAMELMNAINEEYKCEPSTEEELDQFIELINSKIAPFDQKIKRIKHDVVKKEFIVFVITVEDEINKKLLRSNPLDREYFRLLLQELTLNNYKMERIVALNLSAKLKGRNFNMLRAEQLIEEWISVGYLTDHENLLYYGPRTIGEFSEYLAKHYSDYIRMCHLCMAAVLMGTTCDSCDEIFHNDCLRKAFRINLNCPKCKVDWNKPI